MSDGTTVDPIKDLDEKVEGARAPAFPVVPHVPTSGVGWVDDAVLRLVSGLVNDYVKGITINDTRGVVNGGSVNFAIDPQQAPTTPAISEVRHPPAPPEGARPQGDEKMNAPPDSSTEQGDSATSNIQQYDSATSNIQQAGSATSNIQAAGSEGSNIKPYTRAHLTESPEPTTKEDTNEGDPKETGGSSADPTPPPDTDPEDKSKGLVAEQEKDSDRLDEIPEVAIEIANGDSSFFNSAFLPVVLTRGDRKRKILSYILEDNSHVIEGAGAGDKTGYPPAPDSYYTAGGPPVYIPFCGYIGEKWKKEKFNIQQGYVFVKSTIAGTTSIPQDHIIAMAVDMSVGTNVDRDSLAVGTKFWVDVEENAYGIAVSATLKKGESWPSGGTAPELIGGDITVGVYGAGNYRICEILKDGDDKKVGQWLTGNITHDCPELLNNTINSAYSTGDGGRLLKKFNPATGVWEIRELVAGDKMTITESGDTITLEAEGLPSGYRGDMLYHDGTEWVVLTNPGDAGAYKQWVMHHKGANDDPEWVLYDEVTVNICISGTPTGYKILGIPTP
jgi:hypothetical protein|tara:strand:+ start:2382 stop:4058 length:1677 start_codon:yes stop_codon:yes gene_type:complete